jgi:hypothetical protein
MSEGSDLYSPESDKQLDALQTGADEALYNAVLDAIDQVLDSTEQARQASPPLRDANGKPLYATVVMYERDPRWFVFWGERDVGVVILGVASLPTLPDAQGQ